jgi:hypothetical protein
MAISIDLAIGSVATSGGGGTVGTGFLQITGGVLDTTLRNVTDNSATPVVSPLQLSTTRVDVAGRLNSSNSLTNDSVIGLSYNGIHTVTSNGVFYSRALNLAPLMTIASGVTNTSALHGTISFVLRNYLTTLDSGTLSNLAGYEVSYGTSNTDLSATPITTNAYGFKINPFFRTGTTTNAYDIYISPVIGSATVTNAWGIYQDNTKNNYFGGNIGVATTSTSARLQVKGDGTNPIQIWDAGGAGTEVARMTNAGVISFIPNNSGISFYGTGIFFINSGLIHDYTTNGYHRFRGLDLLNGTKIVGIESNCEKSVAGSTTFRPLNIEYTINNSALQTGTATGIFLNATEGAVSPTSGLNGMTHNLMDLKVGGESRIKVDNAGRVFTGNSIIIQIGSSLSWSDRTVLNAPADGNLRITNSAGNNFGLLQLGGTTNAFPAIKRNGAELEARFADDSGFCNFQAAVGRFTGFNTSAFTNNFALGSNANIKQKLVIEDGSPTAITASALVELKSTTLGFLPPRMTDTEVRTITTPAEGLVVFNTTISHLCIFASNSWHKLNYSGM